MRIVRLSSLNVGDVFTMFDPLAGGLAGWFVVDARLGSDRFDICPLVGAGDEITRGCVREFVDGRLEVLA